MVGRVGSLISQGVYSFAVPFHPFGGAIDIIVVEQEDGTYRSMPWYVRFGKFQGIIKGAEKVVTITVNGVEADFHMYLDHSGQAYFMREIEGSDVQSSGLASVESSPHKSSQDDAIGNNAKVNEEHREGEKDEHSCQYPDEHSPLHRSCSSPGFSPYGYGNLEDMEEMVKSSNDASSEMVLISVDGHVLTAPISANEEESTNFVQSTNPQFHLGPGEGSGEGFDAMFGDLDESAFKDENASGHQSEGPKNAKGDTDESSENNQIDTHGGEDTSIGASVCYEERIRHADVVSGSKDSRARGRHDDLFKSCLDLPSVDASAIQDGESQDKGLDLEDNLNHWSKVASLRETTREENAIMDNLNCKPDEFQCVQTRIEAPENSVSVDSRSEDVMMASDVSVNAEIPSSENSPAAHNVTDSLEKVSMIENMAHTVDSVSDYTEMTGSISRTSDTDGEHSHHRTERSTFGLSMCIYLLDMSNFACYSDLYFFM